MSALVRCPQCDTFIKPASIDSGSCPFCPSSNKSKRNAIPGLVLAASLSIAPACSSSPPEPEAAPTPNVIVEDKDTDKKEIVPDATPREVVEPIPAAVYGGAAMYDPDPLPEPEPPPLPIPTPDKK